MQRRLRSLAPRAPGVVVAVVDADGVREQAAIGWADFAQTIEATPSTPWPWFSMTKVFTVTTAMRMALRGDIDLDEPVAKHVPAVRRLWPASWAARITARHLMSHSSGIANPIPLRWIRRPTEPAPDVDALAERRLLEHRRLRFAPGKRARYTNLGTLVLGALLQRLSKTPFQTLVRREVLEPLGMSRTGFDLPNDAAVGHHPRWNPMRLIVPQWVVGPSRGPWLTTRPYLVDGPPYGGLVGPLEDLVRFVRMHLRDGELDGARVITPASAVAMRTIATLGRPFDLGLGWFRPSKSRRADPPFVEHLGSGPGFLNVMRLYPTRGLGVVVLGNATSYDVDAIAALAVE